MTSVATSAKGGCCSASNAPGSNGDAARAAAGTSQNEIHARRHSNAVDVSFAAPAASAGRASVDAQPTSCVRTPKTPADASRRYLSKCSRRLGGTLKPFEKHCSGSAASSSTATARDRHAADASFPSRWSMPWTCGRAPSHDVETANAATARQSFLATTGGTPGPDQLSRCAKAAPRSCDAWSTLNSCRSPETLACSVMLANCTACAASGCAWRFGGAGQSGVRPPKMASDSSQPSAPRWRRWSQRSASRRAVGSVPR
mmetsp:Transcript_18726/g.57699  ORF Transcript_18726/g.57699 Transcript_18726/m.57699 type:complete len:258 (+) Transcript_18726:1113-1886(+)